MDPSEPFTGPFPLVARFRPACLPLPSRVQALADLAEAAGRQNDQGQASAVYNQSALLASDLGLPGLARTLCRQHATAYLHACPLPAMSAIRGLEPVVNLARLQVRAGHADDGRRRLLQLYEAVSTGRAAEFDGIPVPADLTTSAEQRREVHGWLWRVLLADGSRTYTTAGRWQEALAHIEQHQGVGTRMLDGRQVAVLANLTAGNTEHAAELLSGTASGDEWEQVVTACLAVFCRRYTGEPVGAQAAAVVRTYLRRQPEPGLTVFDIRLGLAILDAVGPAGAPAAHRLAEDLVRRTLDARDGYAARDILSHPACATTAGSRHTRSLTALGHSCALGAGVFPDGLRERVLAAARAADRVIRESLGHPSPAVNAL
ncbi:hypothetical protein LIX60_04515 [Streptomyces sp. S07_1.15]|uniref:hypothetical protein n=1 Tax=Streptomyces sp. S07_1.15 TaxID=2873925 RepID=UPI001D1510A6|nr:hypothetical protein [Streptomyces sp. S07_1.15]MCC3650753.1 hypothetical protein [Streptomyces sp. S07_1.15]